MLPLVDVDAETSGSQSSGEFARRRLYLRQLRAPADRNDDHLVRGESWWQDQPLVVAVGHDDPADHPGGHPPGCGVAQLELSRLVRVPDAEGLGEVGAHVVGGSGLERLAVAHHALDAERPGRAGEPLPRGLLTFY